MSDLESERDDQGWLILLGGAVWGPPGSMAKGARAIRAWASDHAVRLIAHDGSGLSHSNRITTEGMVELLVAAGRLPWGPALRATLPQPGQGTLAGALAGLRVRAKTGTLLGGVSALSGWVWLARTRRWAESPSSPADSSRVEPRTSRTGW